MKPLTRKKLRWRIGTQTETIVWIDRVEEKERSFCYFPDGHQQAIRVMVNRDTNELLWNDDGTAKILAPWLLSDIFEAWKPTKTI